MPPEGSPDKKNQGAGAASEKPKRRLMVYQTKENFESDVYTKALKKRPIVFGVLPKMRSALKPHQVAGVGWLSAVYLAGWPGVLLADDMGVGKTIQALAFMALLKENGVLRRGRPALIVAPTSLLSNWQNEHELHLVPPGLDGKLVAYGRSLRDLRLAGGNEAERASELLDTATMRNASWVLTTYETLRDYQFSFARIPFSCVILDEVQKAKNPRSRLTAALKSINSDFTIGLTGTPVENSLADLWTISDIVAPGLLPPLNEFARAYPPKDSEALLRLSQKLLESQPGSDGSPVPSFALRRMKADIAADLPEKHPGNNEPGSLQVEDMPRLQADKYSDVDAQAQSGKLGILRALHDFRSISLHPIDPAALSGQMDAKSYIAQSARMRRAFEILKEIHSKNEKVLIFVNSRKIPNVLVTLIERSFNCPSPMIIRGDVFTQRRQPTVDEFSQLHGFAALILSPRAAGVGLNITAANHVIHLDRWWNPAVEDQCTDRAYRIGQKKPVWV